VKKVLVDLKDRIVIFNWSQGVSFEGDKAFLVSTVGCVYQNIKIQKKFVILPSTECWKS